MRYYATIKMNTEGEGGGRQGGITVIAICLVYTYFPENLVIVTVNSFGSIPGLNKKPQSTVRTFQENGSHNPLS